MLIKKKKKTKGSADDVVPLATLSRLDPRSSFPSFVHGQPPRSAALHSSPLTANYCCLAGVVFLLTRFDQANLHLSTFSRQTLVGVPTHAQAIVFGWFQSLLDLVNNPFKLPLRFGLCCWILSLQSNMGVLGFFLSLI